MRRTYRSKKEAGDGVDHREMVLSVDSKSSIFDAYYIQNIKQVKRELSCVTSTNPYTSSYKARKRKYVKRLKEPEPIRESLSESAYLTPDKSIHVNRTPDLFDQLLNSLNNSSPKSSKNNINVQSMKRGTRTARMYHRKKVPKAKINCSSSEETDSDKENSRSDEGSSHNTSNINVHKLVIEKERVSSSISLDESIDRVVKRLPILNKLSREGITEFADKSSRCSKFTPNVTQSPILQASPQCSTPFHEKYRGKSIYNFSPINLTLINEPAKSETKDDILNKNSHLDQFNHRSRTDSIVEKSLTKDASLGYTNDKKTKNTMDMLEENEKDAAFQTGFNINEDTRNSNIMQQHEDAEKLEIESYILVNNELSTEITSLHTTELEPFLGFPTNTSQIPERQYNEEVDNCEDNCICLTNGSSRNDLPLGNNALLEHSINKSMDNSSDSNTQSINKTNIHIEEANNDTSANLSEISASESMYDTCDSDNISDISTPGEIKPIEPIVVMERLNDSVFLKYYEKMANHSICSDNSNSSNCMISDNELSGNISESDCYKEVVAQDDMSYNSLNDYKLGHDDISNSENLGSASVHIISSSENDKTDSNEMEEEDNTISFVTTRRRNDVTNDSFLFNFDNSFNSTSSASIDKTVLSNNIDKLETDTIEDKTLGDESADIDKYIQEDTKDEHVEEYESRFLQPSKEESLKVPLQPIQEASDEGMAHVSTRKSSRLFRESTNCLSQIQRDESCAIKPGIVLKPGKKWERSLSIYRRMTTMGDNFDLSVLDEESMKSKGRKYRQSVISTMEMQECQGSLHNESVYSRRSTFVSRPSRSSIKIYKVPDASSISLSSSILYDDLEGFLNGDCDDTVIELSKLSIGDSEHEVTVLDKFHDTANRIVTAHDYVLRRCNQTEPVLFDECYPDTVLKNCRKIGEGVYGEVFLWRAGDGRARVMKIVPIAGTTKVNGEVQKDYHEIISEIVIAMELSALRAPIPEIERQLDDGKEIDALDLQSVQNATDVFNEVLAIRCVYGPYPSRLLDLWELYDECKGSENDSPAALPPDQHYIVLELANAGQDLESYQFTNAEQAYALFKQIALGLAVAEEAFQFEHRDLHWGNVLIAPTDQKYATFVVRGRLHRTARCGVAATLIDYSLSRAARGTRALYNDLADDEALFDAVGDYQFEVYRLMRDKLGNDWKNFEPYTNILWLHYTVDKMITALRYTRTNTKIHKHYIVKLKEIKNRVLSYGSATQFILTDNEF